MAIKVSGTTVIDSGRNADVTSLSIGGIAVTATAAELNYMDGVTSNVQTQLDSISVTSGSLTKSFASGETSSISLSSALSPAPVVSVTKEVPQTGIVSKGAWDVATNGANYDRLDSAYDTTLTPSAEGWDISTTSFVQNFYIGSEESSPSGVFFKPDGTKMYVTGDSGDDINEYNLTTAWDVSTASYFQNFSVVGQENYPTDFFFKPDGTKMYVTGYGVDNVNEYNLSTAWDVSTASYSQNFSVAAQETAPQGLFFKPDGTKMYVAGDSGNDINEYNLTTAWDVSTASYSQNFSVAGQETNPQGVFFKPDGSKMYVIGHSADNVNEYNLSTAWDISTSVYSQSFFIGTEEAVGTGFFFKPDGSKMYVIGRLNTRVNEYDIELTKTLALGSGSFASTDLGKTIEGNGGVAVLTATDGSYAEVTAFTDSSTIAAGDWAMYGAVFDATNGLEMSLTAINTWDISTAVLVQSLYVQTLANNPTGTFFKPDGTKMYITTDGAAVVLEYDLTTAWDISTASYSQSFSVSAQELYPQDIFFKPDGTKMYVLGRGGDAVSEYDLIVAWNAATATYSQNFSVAVQENDPRGFFFKPDGTKMYVVGSSGDDVNEYNLSVAWDVSTATYSQVFSVNAQENDPRGVFFKPDGTKMYVVGRGQDRVFEYNLSTAWDVSTASFLQNFSVSAQDTDPQSIFFKPDGTKLYVTGGYSNDSVYEYDIGSIAAVTAQYTPSITNSGGQINSAYWLDINGMTTDEAAGDGNVYYAVSTDDRTTWSVINEADGVRPIVRDNAGTWEYNTAVSVTNAFNISTASYVQNFSVASQDSGLVGVFFKPDGTKMYTTGFTADSIYEYDLGSAWDISAASYSQSFSVSAQETGPYNVFFKPDGTKMYVIGTTGDDVNEYDLSTAWDISTASFVQNFSVSAQDTSPSGIFFKPDGTKMFILGEAGDDVNEYDLSTAWDVSTSVYSQNFSVSSQHGQPRGLSFSPDGTKMLVSGKNSSRVSEYSLTSAWDISTTSHVRNLDVSPQISFSQAVFFKPDGTKMYVTGEDDIIYEYNIGSVDYTTSTTWVSAATNTELTALQEALTEVSINRMDKTQLEAVTDPNHYTLGDTLDLMIGLYLGSASASVPSSDGVSINYDAETLNKGAILGTDYDYDFPDSTTVRITSNAAQNLKVRVV